MTLAAVDRDERAQQHQDVDPVGLDPPRPAIDLDAGRVEDAAFDVLPGERSGDPEAVISSLVANQNPASALRRRPDPYDELAQIAAGDPVDARPIPLGRRNAEHPGFLAQFDRGINRMARSLARADRRHRLAPSGLVRATRVPEGADRRPHRIFLEGALTKAGLARAQSDDRQDARSPDFPPGE